MLYCGALTWPNVSCPLSHMVPTQQFPFVVSQAAEGRRVFFGCAQVSIRVCVRCGPKRQTSKPQEG
jgi:hypothetical protein